MSYSVVNKRLLYRSFLPINWIKEVAWYTTKTTVVDPPIKTGSNPIKEVVRKEQEQEQEKEKEKGKGKGKEKGKPGEQELSNRKKFMATPVNPSTLELLEKYNLGIVKDYRPKAKKIYTPQTLVNLPSIQYFAAAKDISSIPTADKNLLEVGVLGRSNVGKSKLLNQLFGLGSGLGSIVRYEDRPGVTQQLVFFNCKDKFNLVDMPGYGFAYVKEEVKLKWEQLIFEYLSTRSTLRCLLLLLDARHGIKNSDREILVKLQSLNINVQVVLTKCDLVVRQVLARRYDLVQKELHEVYKFTESKVFPVSSKTNFGLNPLRKHILIVTNNHTLIHTENKQKNIKEQSKDTLLKPKDKRILRNKTELSRQGKEPNMTKKEKTGVVKEKVVQKHKVISLETFQKNIYDQ